MPATSKKYSSTDILDNARSALSTASKLAPLIPVPIISSVFMTAQAIITEAERVRTNKQGAIELAQFTVDLVDDITKVLSRRQEMINAELLDALKSLQGDLENTRKTMQSHTNLSIYERVVKRGTLAEELTECRQKLENSLRKFMMSSVINTQLQLEKVQEDVSAAHEILRSERRFDSRNRYRIYREGEVDIIRCNGTIKKHTRIKCIGWTRSPEPEYGEVYEAEIEGRTRTVHYYRDPEMFKWTLDVLDSLRQARHLPFAQLEGCSPETSDTQFLVLKGSASQLIPLFHHIGSMSMEETFIESIRLMNSYLDVTQFLFNKGLRVQYRFAKDLFYINANKEVIVGAHNEIIANKDDYKQLHFPCHSVFWEKGGFLIQLEDAERAMGLFKSANLPELYTLLANGDRKAPLDTLLRYFYNYMSLGRRDETWTGTYIGVYMNWRPSETEVPNTQPSPNPLENSDKHKILRRSNVLGLICMRVLDNKSTTFYPLYTFPSEDTKTCGLLWYTKTCHCNGTRVPLKHPQEAAGPFVGAKLIKGELVRHIRINTPLDHTSLCEGDVALNYKIAFAKYGLPIARQLGYRLKDLVLAYSVTQQLYARVYEVPEGLTLYFHVRPRNEDGFFPVPWGYFSTDPTPYDSISQAKYKETDKYTTRPARKYYLSDIPGVDACVGQGDICHCWKTTEKETALLSLLYDRCADTMLEDKHPYDGLVDALREAELHTKHDDPAQCRFIDLHSGMFFANSVDGDLCCSPKCANFKIRRPVGY